MHVQPHYYRVRQVEPCRQKGWSSQALFLSILVLGTMPKQQQPHQWNTRQMNCTNMASSMKVGLDIETVPMFKLYLQLRNITILY